MKYTILLALLLFFPSATHALNLQNPINVSDPDKVIGNIIQGILGITGSVALLFFVYGGLTWMTAQGRSEWVDRGRRILVWATIGLIVIFSSYAILSQFFDVFAA
ncbi:MAG: TrbC/VirB2 family protein [Patescibacteria group bacterium]